MQEFLTVFTGVDDPVELAYAWEDLLRTADLNGDGDISKDELLLYCLGDEPLTAEGDFEDEELAAHLSVELKKLRAAAALGQGRAGEAASAKRAAALKAKLTGPAAAVFVQLFEAIDADGSGQFEEDEGKVGVRRVA